MPWRNCLPLTQQGGDSVPLLPRDRALPWWLLLSLHAHTSRLANAATIHLREK